jgi:beta-glucosidase/6-phospho-beta-glucosidase/beta-galactosidase
VATSLTKLQANHGGAVTSGGVRGGATMLVATGIECSYPTVQNGHRRDELEATQHYTRWREDLDLCRSIGATYVRYGFPYYRMHLGPGRYDWAFADEVLPAFWDLGLIPIVDLCHFGVPDWIGGFQNPDWPTHFAEYAAAFADRFPWIKFYTPVNEMLVCARFSGLYGLWNEQKSSDRDMVAAHKTQCRASVLAMVEILKTRPDAVFVQSEIAEVYLERWPQTRADVQFRNHLRFLTFDFLYGAPPHADVLNYLYDHGLTREEYDWFMEHGRGVASHCVLGMDYYSDNERTLRRDGSMGMDGSMLGWGVIALDYYQRYHRPMMLTETNTIELGGNETTDWLLRTWHQAQHLRHHGVPMIGYTWYSLTDQIDWDIQLREIRGKVTPNGLFTLDRQPRDAAKVFRELAQSYAGSPLLENIPGGLPGSGGLVRHSGATFGTSRCS